MASRGTDWAEPTPAGPIDDAEVAAGEARLAALLPPDWQRGEVSEHPEYRVYIARHPDGSQRTWEYQVRWDYSRVKLNDSDLL